MTHNPELWGERSESNERPTGESDHERIVIHQGYSMKSCSTCVFFDAPKAGHASGTCQYPVPEYLRIGGCPYISMPDYSGGNCAVHKSRAELIEAAKEGV